MGKKLYFQRFYGSFKKTLDLPIKLKITLTFNHLKLSSMFHSGNFFFIKDEVNILLSSYWQRLYFELIFGKSCYGMALNSYTPPKLDFYRKTVTHANFLMGLGLKTANTDEIAFFFRLLVNYTKLFPSSKKEIKIKKKGLKVFIDLGLGFFNYISIISTIPMNNYFYSLTSTKIELTLSELQVCRFSSSITFLSFFITDKEIIRQEVETEIERVRDSKHKRYLFKRWKNLIK